MSNEMNINPNYSTGTLKQLARDAFLEGDYDSSATLYRTAMDRYSMSSRRSEIEDAEFADLEDGMQIARNASAMKRDAQAANGFGTNLGNMLAGWGRDAAKPSLI